MNNYVEDGINLLKQMIATPSFSREEDEVATIIEKFLKSKGVETHRLKNNVYAYNKYYDASKPTILLNSHHDTVRPNANYTKDPFHAEDIDGKIYGLGSTDAGGCLVSLIATFLHFYEQKNLKYNLLIATTAEEEVAGANGIELLMKHVENVDFAIVGEPTQMQLAIGEKGVMVLECTSNGIPGHAARDEGENAIYNALEDILWFKNYKFPKKSELFGDVKMSVTLINSGTQHNVIPSVCEFVVDVRVTDAYTHEEILDIVRKHVQCEVKPRSTRLRPSKIDVSHPVVQAGIKIGRETFGSPTTSDQTLLNIPSVKIGPGKSARSHSANEYIYRSEIEEGIDIYCKILNELV
ncbi:M20 family metallo-hydrolase [Capnocytophaga sp. ARDL2]|uniref:M20 family metallo-hydrolase n=1 Tax=Capnocytophaga sp. ARDL2 TaxID=3238809 RepID=UPI0035563538